VGTPKGTTGPAWLPTGLLPRFSFLMGMAEPVHLDDVGLSCSLWACWAPEQPVHLFLSSDSQEQGLTLVTWGDRSRQLP
jgi:hypothetical protein